MRPLHHRAQLPRPELVLAVAMSFALGGLAGGSTQDELEDPLAHLGDIRLAVDDLAAVDVHVLFLAHPKNRVGGEFERRRGRATISRAAAGGEADHVGTAGNLAGGRDRVVPRRIHVNETALGDPFGVFVDRVQVAGAALGNGAERLLENRRQPARLVAWRRVVVHFAVVDLGVVLPPLDALYQLVADGARHGAA